MEFLGMLACLWIGYRIGSGTFSLLPKKWQGGPKEMRVYPCACGCGRLFRKITGWDGMHYNGPLYEPPVYVPRHR